jgi:hypothetical protein
MRRVLAGGVLVGCGLALHLVEPVSALECRRDVPGPARCTIAQSFFGIVPYGRASVQAAALVVEARRLGRVDPEAVSCTALSLMDGAGETTDYACVKDAAAVAAAQRFFAEGSTERALDVRQSETLVLAVSGALVLAGLLLAASGFRPRPTAAR